MDAFARNHKIRIEWSEKGVRKEDYVRPYQQRIERRNRFGVYFILKSMEVGPSFRASAPRFPVEDPDYRIIGRQRCRYKTTITFNSYIRDEVLGPMSMCVGSDLRKMKAHGLVARDGKRYAYRLTAKGNQTALLFVLFPKRVCGPLANSLFNAPPHPEPKPATT